MTGEKGSLHQQLQSARERLQDLRKRAAASPNQQALLEETLAELSISIEELSVSVEELRQQNAELREAQAQLRDQAQLLNLAHDAVLVTDLDNRILYWNFGAQRTYGWSADEAKGKLKHELLQAEVPQGAGVAL